MNTSNAVALTKRVHERAESRRPAGRGPERDHSAALEWEGTDLLEFVAGRGAMVGLHAWLHFNFS